MRAILHIAFAENNEANDISGRTPSLMQLACGLWRQDLAVAILLLDLCTPEESSPLETALSTPPSSPSCAPNPFLLACSGRLWDHQQGPAWWCTN